MSKLFKQNSSTTLSQPLKASKNSNNEREPQNLNLSKQNYSKFSHPYEVQSVVSSQKHGRRSSIAHGIPQSARNQIFSEVTKYNAEFDQQNLSLRSGQPFREVSQISKSRSAAMESFYLSSNVKVLVGANYSPMNIIQNDSICISLNEEHPVLDLSFNGCLYKQYQFSQLFTIPQQYSLFDALLKPQLETASAESNNLSVTSILTYGQKSSGKSELIGTLFENENSQQSLVSQLLHQIFLEENEEETNKEVCISCYEVFLETLTDLFDESNEQFTTETDATWLRVESESMAQQHLRNVFLNRKQIVEENGLSYSQSHLIVNIRIQDSTSENCGHMFSFMDLVGFDHGFTQKIMNGETFGIHNQSIMQQEMINETKLQFLISECNDNNLYSLRNLLLAIENDSDQEIQQALNETTLARVVFAKLLQSQNFYVLGTVNPGQSSFNETLNTLEFCTKFQQALTPSTMGDQTQNVLFSIGAGEENILTTEGQAALPQEVSAYLETNQTQDQMSRFYHNKSNVMHSHAYFPYRNNGNNQTTVNISKAVLNKSNVSINSMKMLTYLEKFFVKKQEEQSYNKTGQKSRTHSRNLPPRMFKDQPIRIQQDYLLEGSQNQSSLNNKKLQPSAYPRPPSERSTGFATNTQLTHLRKYSQDVNLNNKREQTYSEIHYLEEEIKQQQRVFNIENFSKIQGKSKFDSSFLSTYIIHGETPQVKAAQKSNILIQNQRNSSSQSQVSSSVVTPQIQKQLPPKFQLRPQENKTKNVNPLAQHFLQSVIRESMKAVTVQLKDFSDFFLKDKSQDGCFPCSNTQSSSFPSDPSTFSNVFQTKRQKFFDLDKVLKDIEQKELRQQTLISIRDSTHRKNNKSVNMVKQQHPQFIHEPAKQIQQAKNQLRRGQSIANLGKENPMPHQSDFKQSLNRVESLNQLTFPLSAYTMQFTQDRPQDSRAMTDLLNLMSMDKNRNAQ